MKGLYDILLMMCIYKIKEEWRMNMDALKKAIPVGIGSGILTWVFLSLFELLFDKSR